MVTIKQKNKEQKGYANTIILVNQEMDLKRISKINYYALCKQTKRLMVN